MSSVLTTAGRSLIARLQAGEKLVIDRFIFAYIPGLDPSEPLSPDAGLPEGSIVYEYAIPEAYRSYMGPDQVVYSAALGSDIGDFSMNWQGLYCSQYDTLMAASTFHPIQKTALDLSAKRPGNNITRNFILKFAGAGEITGIDVEAGAWQMDYTLRLGAMDERERLANRDIYGRASFIGEAWKVEKTDAEYNFQPGLAYLEGIRAELESEFKIQPSLPCSVWLDVSRRPEGSEVVTSIRPVLAGLDEELADYTGPEPVQARHYLHKVAEIDAAGEVRDKRDHVCEKGDVLTIIDGKPVWEKPYGMPLLSILFDPSSLAKPGYLNAALNHGLLPRAAFPQAAAEIQRRFAAGDSAVVTEDVWLKEFADVGACPKFSIGDGETNFRIPMLAGLYPGAPMEGQEAGEYLNDQFQGHLHFFGKAVDRHDYVAGPWLASAKPDAHGMDIEPSTAKSYVSDGLHGMPRVGKITRPRTAVMTPFIKMYGEVTEASEANIAALIQLTTELNGKLRVENWRSEDGKSWYRKYSDGWVEQGGVTEPTSSYTSLNVNYLIPMASPVYPQVSRITDYAGTGDINSLVIRAVNSNGFLMNAGGATAGMIWTVKGQGAE